VTPPENELKKLGALAGLLKKGKKGKKKKKKKGGNRPPGILCSMSWSVGARALVGRRKKTPRGVLTFAFVPEEEKKKEKTVASFFS